MIGLTLYFFSNLKLNLYPIHF